MVFFILSILLYLLQNYSNKKFCLGVGKSAVGISLVQNAICCLCASAVLFATCRPTVLGAEALLLAVLFGATYLGTVFLLLCAFMRGVMGLSTLLCNVGMFIAAFYGMLRFGDPFTPFIAGGYVCMLAAVIFATPKKQSGEKGGIVWFMFALGSGLCNGAVASVKREAVGFLANGVQPFLAAGFLFAGLFALLFALATKQNRAYVRSVLGRPKVAVFGVLAGVGTAGANLCQMLSLSFLPSTVVYPLTSGILVVSLWLASLLIYKETTAKPRNIVSVILCVVAIVLVNIKS